MSHARQLLEFGQSLWLDYIDRDLLTHGGLRALVARGIRGVTSNPSIFEKAITGGDAYDEPLRALLHERPDLDAERLYERLVIEDVQQAADVLGPVYRESGGGDGYVSLEVAPRLAHDTGATIDQARRLWRTVARPNLMIKVPATRAGLGAIETLTAEGINVNVTLLFAVTRYEEVVAAFLRGLARNPHPERIGSVASFFVSRIDSKVDPRLDKIGSDAAKALRGRIAIANARMAYRSFRRLIEREEYAAQRRRGARLQRLLWGSTSSKDPAYPDLIYVDNLIGPDTVNTVPPDTFDAILDHARPQASLESDDADAHNALAQLPDLGIDLDAITRELEDEGIVKFARSYDALLAALAAKRTAAVG